MEPEEEEEGASRCQLPQPPQTGLRNLFECAWSTPLKLASTLYEMQTAEVLHGCGKLSGVV